MSVLNPVSFFLEGKRGENVRLLFPISLVRLGKATGQNFKKMGEFDRCW